MPEASCPLPFALAKKNSAGTKGRGALDLLYVVNSYMLLLQRGGLLANIQIWPFGMML